MKRYYELLAALLCAAAASVFIACFEAHFANEEGKYLFVYTADLLKRFWPFGEWHYPGAPVNGNGALFLQVFFSQFYYTATGIYAVMLPAFGLWLYGWYRYGRRMQWPAWCRGAIVYPLATALFLFAAVSPKFPPGLLWGLLAALWLCLWCGGRREGRTCLWGAWLAGAFLFMSMGFYPFLFFAAGFSGLYWTQCPQPHPSQTNQPQTCKPNTHQPHTPHRTGDCPRKWLWFGLFLICYVPLPFVWAALSRQPLDTACDAFVIRNWRMNGISKDWRLYLDYQKTWRALRRGDSHKALKHADRYWFSERANQLQPDRITPGEQYFRQYLAEATKLALLTSGELNNRFLLYGTVPELATLFRIPTPMVAFYDPIYLQFYWETGALTAAAFEGVNIIERDGLRADVLPTLALTQVCLSQHGLADKYLYLLRHTLFYRSQAENIAAFNRPDALADGLIRRKRDEISPVPFDGHGKEPRAEMAHLMNVHPHNFYVAEYMTMQYLLEKDLPAVYEVLKHYRGLGYTGKELPIYAQEALLLLIEYGLNEAAFNAVKEGGIRGLEDFRFNPAIIKRFENFLQEKWNFETGRLQPEAFFEKYANSYAFFFFYLKNIDPDTLTEQADAATPSLVH